MTRFTIRRSLAYLGVGGLAAAGFLGVESGDGVAAAVMASVALLALVARMRLDGWRPATGTARRKAGSVVVCSLLVSTAALSGVPATAAADGGGGWGDGFCAIGSALGISSCESPDTTGQVIEDAKEQNAIEDEQTITDLKAMAASQREQYRVHTATRRNYLQDAETFAWSKAEAAMVEEMQSDDYSNKSDVRKAGNKKIRDYWSRHQLQLIQSWNATLQSAEYIDHVAENESGISEDLVRSNGQNWKGKIISQNVTLANGTTVKAAAWVVGDKSGTISTGPVAYPRDVIAGWESNNPTGDFQNVSNRTYEGSYAIKDVEADGADSLDLNIANESYDEFSVAYQHDGMGDVSAGEQDYYQLYADDTSYYAEVEVRETSGTHGNLTLFAGNTQTYDLPVQVEKDTWYKFQFYGIDYTNDTFHMKVQKKDGTVVWDSGSTEYGFLNSASQTTKLSLSANTQGVWYDSVATNGTATYSQLFVKDSEEGNEVIVEFDDYAPLWSDINSTTTRQTDNFDTYANESYDAWRNGTLNASDYLSSSTLASQYAQNYESTGYYTYAVTSLASVGLDTAGAINESSHQEITYHPAGSNETRNLTGMLMSQEGPHYDPNSSRTNGTWYTGVTYNTSQDVNGSVLFVTTNGTQDTLNGTFTIETITDRNGTEINYAETQTYNYEVHDTSKLSAKLDRLKELRSQLEAIEPKLSGYAWNDGGGGGLDLDLGLGGSMGLIALAAGAYLLLVDD